LAPISKFACAYRVLAQARADSMIPNPSLKHPHAGTPWQEYCRADARGTPCAHVLQRLPATRHDAKSLSTICVDKVVHSLKKISLSRLRTRLFSGRPQNGRALFTFRNNMLQTLPREANCLINRQAARKALLWIV
jgi:hypothetical protein